MMLRSITSRLIFFYCVLLAILGAGFLAFTVLNFRHYTREIIASNLGIRADGVWAVSRSLLDNPRRLGAVIELGFSPEVQNRFIRVRIGDRIFYRSGKPADGRFDPHRIPFGRSASGPGGRLVGGVLLVSHDYRTGDGQDVTVDTGQSFHFVETLQTELAESLLIALPVLLVLAALAGYVLMRRALVPVEAMIKTTEKYTFSQPRRRLPLVKNEPRIEALGLALNRLLDRLDNAYSHASRFSADAAHELRTPLTIVRGELELLMREEDLPPHIVNAIDNSLDEIVRLSGIVDSLTMLSRMESMWGKRAHSAVALKELAAQTFVNISPLAVEKEISLIGPVGPETVVAGDRNTLKQVLVNLLDNAIKYTPPKGSVTIRVGSDGEIGFFSVEDTGIGIASAHQDRVFDRFYRVSPDRGEAGAGLGLAIVKSICSAHGGTVSLSSRPGRGSNFRVTIPLMHATKEEVPLSQQASVAAAAT